MESTLTIVYLSDSGEHFSTRKQINTELPSSDRLMTARNLIRSLAENCTVVSAVLFETGLMSVAGTPTAAVTKVYQPSEWLNNGAI
jgi:hypothetical protein